MRKVFLILGSILVVGCAAKPTATDREPASPAVAKLRCLLPGSEQLIGAELSARNTRLQTVGSLTTFQGTSLERSADGSFQGWVSLDERRNSSMECRFGFSTDNRSLSVVCRPSVKENWGPSTTYQCQPAR